MFSSVLYEYRTEVENTKLLGEIDDTVNVNMEKSVHNATPLKEGFV